MVTSIDVDTLATPLAIERWTTMRLRSVLVERFTFIDHFDNSMGILFTLTPNIIASLLRLPHVDRPHYPVLGVDPTTDEVVAAALCRDSLVVFQTNDICLGPALMTEDYRFLNLVVSSVLAPLSYTDIITPDHARFLYVVGTSETIDDLSRIFHYITSAIIGIRRDTIPTVAPTVKHPEDDFLAKDIDQPYIPDLLVLDPVLTLVLGLTVADLDHHYDWIHQDFFLPVMAQIEH
ncbi:hypothetical protein F0562_012292 [Nyssa sinensis]|uniref:Uncharacterized protein n=1 Tax=Nyssa sinensis TaxID=561372 RepID=A0A5J4ZU64_9ASTE|nr:hypothetical protein F0562_012292 [Nyssa sinensis]